MNGIILTPDRNRDGGDFTGAFKPESERFAVCQGIPAERIHRIDISASHPGMRAEVCTTIQSYRGLDFVAVFCHGWKPDPSKGITRWGLQLGFNTDRDGGLVSLASAILEAGAPDCRIILYACSTGGGDQGGDNGLADVLRDRTGFQVDAHSSIGHTTSNPDVVRFDREPGIGGTPLIPRDDILFQKWKSRLKDRDSDPLRFQFPFLSREDIRKALLSS